MAASTDERWHKVKQQVWLAEDGRCQVCGRAMDQRVAQARLYEPRAGVTMDNAFLLCPVCVRHRRSPVPLARLKGVLAAEIAGALELDRVAAAEWLRDHLERYGVVVSAHGTQLDYWLPGIGRFRCRKRATKPPLLTGKIFGGGELLVVPQSRTRGLPRPEWPVDEPW